MTFFNRFSRIFNAAFIQHPGTPSGKIAARGQADRGRDVAGQDPGAPGAGGVHDRDGRQQRLGIRMPGG